MVNHTKNNNQQLLYGVMSLVSNTNKHNPEFDQNFVLIIC